MLYGAVVNMGADPFLVEDEEQAEAVAESMENATVRRTLTDGDEFSVAKERLGLENANVKRIWSYVDGSEFLVCLLGDYS